MARTKERHGNVMSMADPQNHAIEKTLLRRRLRFRRAHFVANLDTLAKMSAFRAPPAPLIEAVLPYGIIGGYAAIGDEADILHLLSDLGTAHAIALPFHGARDDAMTFRRWQPGDTLTTGPWRAPQPHETSVHAQPGALLAPLLGFDRSGGRLGQGGGHYDRYFADRPEVLRIGIGWSVQEVDAVPSADHDLPMDAILTEQEWIVTGDRL